MMGHLIGTIGLFVALVSATLRDFFAIEEIEEDAPFVCPGCHAVGAEPCAPGCIDAELEDERRHAVESGEYDRYCDDDEDEYEPYCRDCGHESCTCVEFSDEQRAEGADEEANHA